MALTVVRAIVAPRHVTAVRYDIPIGATGDAGDVFIGLDPTKNVSIHVQKPGEAAKVYLTNTATKMPIAGVSQGRVTSPDDTDIIWRERSTGTDEFFAGDEKGVTGMKVEADAGTTSAIIKISVLEV